MKAKVTLVARVNDGTGSFPRIPVQIARRRIVIPLEAPEGRFFNREDIIGFYARYSLVGRPLEKESDFAVFSDVEFWREQSRSFGKKGKARKFSLKEALKKVREDRFPRRQFIGAHEDDEIATLKFAYIRGVFDGKTR
jgi:hypothetical protein